MQNLNEILNMTAKPKPVIEKIILPHNRDRLHADLMNKVRLNRYDLRFMSNIDVKYLSKDKPLSEGQNELYEKIIHKYRKQLKKLGVQYRDIIELPWENGIIELDTLNQNTYLKLVKIEDGTTEIQFYFNFNKKQIENVREIVHDDAGNHLNRGNLNSFGNGQKYNFTWDNSEKVWSGPFNVYLFKKIFQFAQDINVQIDKSAVALMIAMESYGSKQDWTPSIRIVNDRLYVNHIVESMLPALETIDPTDLSIANIERFTVMGLAAPASLEYIAEYVNSISPSVKHDVMDSSGVDTLRHYIKDSGRKVVFYTSTGWNRAVPPIPEEFADLDEIANWDVNVKRFDSDTQWADDEVDKLLAAGYNTLISTTPIAELFRSQDQIGKFALAADKVIYLSIAGKT